MKSCSEMTSSVLLRIEEHNTAVKNRNKLLAKIIIPILGICLSAVIGIAAMPEKHPQTAEDALIPGMIDWVDDKNSENVIVVNEVEAISADRQYICLLWEDYVTMTDMELLGYYDTTIFPWVPDDLHRWKDESNIFYGIYRRNGGTGEVYHDIQVLNYSNDDFSRNVNVEVSKGKYPFTCCAIIEELYETSVINGIEVFIATNKSHYYSRFMYKGTGFQLITEGLSIEEIERVIESLTGE